MTQDCPNSKNVCVKCQHQYICNHWVLAKVQNLLFYHRIVKRQIFTKHFQIDKLEPMASPVNYNYVFADKCKIKLVFILSIQGT